MPTFLLPVRTLVVRVVLALAVLSGADARRADAADVEISPTPTNKVRVTDELREIVRAELRELRETAAEAIVKHRTADAFPGAIGDDAPRVERPVTVRFRPDAWRPRNTPYSNARSHVWHSTGLYAAPGEVISVTLDAELASLGLRVRIGCHSDQLWRKDEWSRMPEISRSWPLENVATTVASPFGGLIYLETPFEFERAEVAAMIGNAVEAPFFKLGETTAEAWRATLRQHPAPWAELATDKVVLTVPSTAVRQLDDPTEVLQFWDRVLDANADLAGWPRERRRAERFVADVQISAGYMHSGYPLMTHLDVVDVFVSLDKLREQRHGGIWGFFHEIGHNHQSRDWTFTGTTEVTCNLFTLYVYHTVLDNDDPRRGLKGEARRRAIDRYLAGGPEFDAWKRDPFLALMMYMQLQEEFGWAPFTQVFQEYLEASDRRLPRNDDEKRDQWLVRFSRVVGKNLGPFFDAWGVPTSEAARQSIADLPAWMPESWPQRAAAE